MIRTLQSWKKNSKTESNPIAEKLKKLRVSVVKIYGKSHD